MDHFDEIVDRFRRIGLSESQARIAAIGRDGTEARARAAWCGSGSAAGAAQEAARMVAAAAPAALPAVVQETAAAAQRHLRMNESQALDYATGLYQRENRRAGAAHAAAYLETFVDGLSTAVREKVIR